MKKVSGLKKIILPHIEITRVYEHLRFMGSKGVEGIALWVGEFQSESEFIVTQTVIPKQESCITDFGLHYKVDTDEMHRLNLWLYETGLKLLAQIHSHPSEAYHSEADDAYPIVTKAGSLSIVVPDFAFHPFSLEDWAVYRLSDNGEWHSISKSVVSHLITIQYGNR